MLVHSLFLLQRRETFSVIVSAFMLCSFMRYLHLLRNLLLRVLFENVCVITPWLMVAVKEQGNCQSLDGERE